MTPLAQALVAGLGLSPPVAAALAAAAVVLGFHDQLANFMRSAISGTPYEQYVARLRGIELAREILKNPTALIPIQSAESSIWEVAAWLDWAQKEVEAAEEAAKAAVPAVPTSAAIEQAARQALAFALLQGQISLTDYLASIGIDVAALSAAPIEDLQATLIYLGVPPEYFTRAAPVAVTPSESLGDRGAAIPAAAPTAAIVPSESLAVSTVPPITEVTVPPVTQVVTPAQVTVISPPVTVTVAAPSVAVQPVIPVPSVSVDTAPLAGAVGLVGINMVSALAAAAGDIGHGMSAGRNRCLTDTGMALLQSLAKNLTPLATAALALNLNPLKGQMIDAVTGAWDEILTDPDVLRPVSPDDAQGISHSLFATALQAGMQAHFLGVMAETFTPLKSLGLGYVAAAIGDMAGFNRIGGAMMQTLVQQTMGRSYGYHVLSRSRPVIPDIRTLQALGQEKTLVGTDEWNRLTQRIDTLHVLETRNREEFVKWGAYSGYSDAWLAQLWDVTDRPASYLSLRRVVEAGVWDESYFVRQLVRYGYNSETIGYIMDALRRYSVQAEVAVISTEARYDYLDGFISADTYAATLTELGYYDDRVQANVAAAQTRRQRTLAKKRIEVLQSGVIRGRVTIDDFLTELQRLKLDSESVELLMLETQLKTNVETTALYRTDSGRVEVANIRSARLKGLLTHEQELSELGLREVPESLARAWADQDDLKLYKPEKT